VETKSRNTPKPALKLAKTSALLSLVLRHQSHLQTTQNSPKLQTHRRNDVVTKSSLATAIENLPPKQNLLKPSNSQKNQYTSTSPLPPNLQNLSLVAPQNHTNLNKKPHNLCSPVTLTALRPYTKNIQSLQPHLIPNPFSLTYTNKLYLYITLEIANCPKTPTTKLHTQNHRTLPSEHLPKQNKNTAIGPLLAARVWNSTVAIVKYLPQKQQDATKSRQKPHTSREFWIPQIVNSPCITTEIHLMKILVQSLCNISNQDSTDESYCSSMCRYLGANKKQQLKYQHQKAKNGLIPRPNQQIPGKHNLYPLNPSANYPKIRLKKKTNHYDELCMQDKTGSSRALFQESQAANAANSNNSNNSMLNSKSCTLPNYADTMMTEAINNKRQHGDESTENSKRRAATVNEEQHRNNPYHKLNLWFGFPVMEQLARDAGQQPFDLSDINSHLARGIPQDEARILSSSKISFPRIPQMLWPSARKDGKPGQHYHLMQIPFDAEIVLETGYAKTYQILLHFEKPLRDYSSKEISELAVAQLSSMGMDTGRFSGLSPLSAARGERSPGTA
jgi:hypothetical protein